jgi:sugar phosphate isomerase/epimerase
MTDSPRTRISRDQFALNAIPWFNVKADPADPNSEDLWLIEDPAFRADYPRVLREIRESGFEVAMLEVLPTQTLQSYAAVIESVGLRLAPGYAYIGLPEDHGLSLAKGSAEWVHWFDGVRRKAEESNYFGQGTVFLAPEMGWTDRFVRNVREAAVGAEPDQDRLDRVTEIIAEAAEVLAAEGVRAGLHNHVGTWIETEAEIDHVLGAIDPKLLGASFDIGHLAWTGADAAAVLRRHSDRILDLHIKDLDLEVARLSRETPTPYRDAVAQGLFQEPGRGDLDLVGILDALPEDFGGWVIVEVDRTTLEPIESARISWQWVLDVAA